MSDSTDRAPSSRGGSAPRWFAASLALAAAIVLITCATARDGAQFEPDEYRYLAQIEDHDPARDWRADWVIENRWDHLWWLQPRAALRFFRPVVIQSFRVDGDPATGPPDPRRMVTTNILLHLLCAGLVVALATRLLGAGLPSLVASGLFAAMACHGEAIWYVTGRNATLAAGGVLMALLCHFEGVVRGRPGLRALALLPFAFALGAKESALAVPLWRMLFDRLEGITAPWRVHRRLYAGYLGLIAGYLILRHVVLGATAPTGGELFPYLVLDGRLPLHLATQVATYGASLGLGTTVPPFATWPTSTFDGIALTVFGGLAAVFLVGARHDRRIRFCVLLGATAWLPAAVVYVSERYLYLPSLAWACLVGLGVGRVLDHTTGRPLIRAAVLALVAGVGVLQANRLNSKLTLYSDLRPATAIAETVRAALPELPASRQLMFIHYPADWVSAQFLEAQLRVIYQAPDLRVRVLTPLSFGVARLQQEGPRTLRVQGERPVLDAARRGLPWRRLDTGARYRGPGFEVEVLAGTETTAHDLRLRFDTPLRDVTVLQFELPDRPALSRARWIRAGRFRAHRLR